MWKNQYSKNTPIPHYARSDPRNLHAAHARNAVIRAREAIERLDPLCLSPEAYIARRARAPVHVTPLLCGDPPPGRSALYALEHVPYFPQREIAPPLPPKSFRPLTPAATGILALCFDGCRFPVGDPRASDFHFCGKARLPDKPYCEAHKKVCCL